MEPVRNRELARGLVLVRISPPQDPSCHGRASDVTSYSLCISVDVGSMAKGWSTPLP
jgi:hypothetical protein